METRDQITKHPCAVCGNAERSELNRHHLLDKSVRRKGTAQLTIKLCKDQRGCKTHLLFHNGDREAAQNIRLILEPADIAWMEGIMGKEWVDKVYPV